MSIAVKHNHSPIKAIHTALSDFSQALNIKEKLSLKDWCWMVQIYMEGSLKAEDLVI